MSQQIPDRNNPLGLFEYSVRRVIQPIPDGKDKYPSGMG